MKVLCINAGKVKVKSGHIYDATGILEEGKDYTVIDTVVNDVEEYGYVLAEIKSSSRLHNSFNVIRFIPLSDKDEKYQYTIASKKDYLMNVITNRK